MDSKKLLIVIIIVATVLLGSIGTVGYILWQRQQPHVPEAIKKEEPKEENPKGPPILFEINNLLCMLNEPAGESIMLSFGVSLDLQEEKDKEEIKDYLPLMIDILLQTCNDLSSAQVSGPKGQITFKTEAKKRLNAEFKKRTDKEPIRDILYNNYIISNAS